MNISKALVQPLQNVINVQTYFTSKARFNASMLASLKKHFRPKIPLSLLRGLFIYEVFEDIETAIEREKKIKKWNRIWKDNVIYRFNPELKDLFDQIQEFQ